MNGVVGWFGFNMVLKQAKLKDNRQPVGIHDPEKGTYLYEIKRLWKKAKGRDKEFLAQLYDHLNALYVEQMVYRKDN